MHNIIIINTCNYNNIVIYTTESTMTSSKIKNFAHNVTNSTLYYSLVITVVFKMTYMGVLYIECAMLCNYRHIPCLTPNSYLMDKNISFSSECNDNVITICLLCIFILYTVSSSYIVYI